MNSRTFSAELWLHSEMPGSWYFMTLPLDAADEIRAGSERRGFGSVRVRATIGTTTWDTSVFPDAETGSFLLPVKAAVRSSEELLPGETARVTITTRP